MKNRIFYTLVGIAATCLFAILIIGVSIFAFTYEKAFAIIGLIFAISLCGYILGIIFEAILEEKRKNKNDKKA